MKRRGIFWINISLSSQQKLKLFASEIENWFQIKNFFNYSVNIVLTYSRTSIQSPTSVQSYFEMTYKVKVMVEATKILAGKINE